MASVQGRGRRNRIPYSHYAPIRVTDDKPLYKVLASDAVPQGLSGVTKNQQIGYWNEQVRWRMRRGERVELPSNWHFYYLGTGPHSEVPFRKRTEGVYWVALAGSKTEPTNLGERKPSVKPLEPDFKTRLPSNVEVVEPTTPQNSRANSRSRSRGPQSRNSSNSTSDSQSRNNYKKDQPRNQSSRPQSRNRNQSSNRNQSNDKEASSKEDLIAAVAEALKSLGIGQKPDQPKQQPRHQVKFNNKGSNTPKSKSRSNSASRTNQKDKPEWRRTPTGEDTVEACFGSRGGFRNFGDSEMLQKGVQASGYAQIAGLVPSSPALLFGGNVAVKELADDVEITYTYKMTVPKDDPNLALFLAQVDAYKNGSARPQRVKKQRRAKSPAPPTQTDGMLAQDGEEPIYDDVASMHTHDSGEDTQFEMVNEVFANDTSSSTA
uniref:Nucleoprotein n=2 Tax=unclassified Orthocoronavirinae TaxID=2730119 RepID=A0AA49IED7_9NIDO|nr:nucleocapsid phosphoprotein [Bat Coronavirus MrGD19]WCC62410.1 nucleocapsid phosphoprotein [Bat Coronavirus MrGD19]WCC62482.1 nucleocapsid phosphoprotein [Bat Coronavirus MrJX20]